LIQDLIQGFIEGFIERSAPMALTPERSAETAAGYAEPAVIATTEVHIR
jgi:hypothetical protein